MMPIYLRSSKYLVNIPHLLNELTVLYTLSEF